MIKVGFQITEDKCVFDYEIGPEKYHQESPLSVDKLFALAQSLKSFHDVNRREHEEFDKGIEIKAMMEKVEKMFKEKLGTK